MVTNQRYFTQPARAFGPPPAADPTQIAALASLARAQSSSPLAFLATALGQQESAKFGELKQPWATSPANTPFVNQLYSVRNGITSIRDNAEAGVKSLGDYFTTSQGQIDAQNKPAGVTAAPDDNLKRLLAALGGGGGSAGPGASYGAVGGGGGVVPTVYDPSFDLKALDMVQQAGALASAPKVTNLGPNGYPQIPDALKVAPTDFSAYDAHMAAAAPVSNLTAERQHQMRVDGVLGGLAQAAQHIGSDTPAGTILLQMGAGMLGGKASANRDIQEGLDKYDAKNSAYQMALANGDVEKAKTLHEDATREAEQTYKTTMARIADARPQIQGDNIITHGKDVNGNDIVTVTPLSNAVQADTLIKMVPIFQSMSLHSNAARAATASDVNQARNNDAILRSRAAIAGGKNGDGTVDPAVAIGLGVGRAFDQGTFEQLLPADDYNKIKKFAQASAKSAVPLTMAGGAADAQRLQAYRSAMLQSLINVTVSSPLLTDKVFGTKLATAGARAAPVIKPKKDSQR